MPAALVEVPAYRLRFPVASYNVPLINGIGWASRFRLRFEGGRTMAQSGKMAGNRSYLSGIGRHAVGLIVIVGMSASLYSSPATAEDAGGAPAARSKGPYKYTNRLADSNDPYLLLHAHNPVGWYPCGPGAFAHATPENKPLFLSI